MAWLLDHHPPMSGMWNFDCLRWVDLFRRCGLDRPFAGFSIE
jgi:hypothetical protein